MVGRVAAWRAGPVVISSLVNTPYESVRLEDPAVRRWKLKVAEGLDTFTIRFMVDRLHAVSAGVATVNARALRVDPARITVVHRGRSRDDLGRASVERRSRVRAALGIAEDAPMVLAVGRQDFQKAHVHLLEAAELLTGDLPDLSVLLAGRTGRRRRPSAPASPRARMPRPVLAFSATVTTSRISLLPLMYSPSLR